MKKYLLIISALVIIATSCKKDPIEDTCVPPSLKENILGKWTIKKGDGEVSTSTVEFQDKGKYIDDDNTLVILPGDPKLYQAKDSTVVVKVGTTSGILKLTQNNCDSIHFTFIGVDIAFYRVK